jgi:hypothetical protein
MAAVQRQAEAQVTTIVRTEGDARIQTVKIVVPNFDVLEEVRTFFLCLFSHFASSYTYKQNTLHVH